ncbi:flavin-dependent dehydrogenase [Saccharopolyspora erythraea NRRL 2338]|uniref:FAD dependent oxidoreductase n=2 Tax=Saccharopolyspora erythraea TaxID=1836 RepID=A4FIF5_SACEN|nr:NAD(P)-binding protein [Saccharopolyspora erythraea]EQD87921.1 FAD-dependent oxidoreductase [Saccharopolyspora erythraea D]PFG97506.1 flavin-dependent dehydrogenase [Saccharopolyspora erythraea NRRL 2338]QRK87679.1 FAD-dependent monooxygenase [Saccharopolyspora erythraea]CAM03830.1 FAD dependent oxidoreductase [Saccharopolyspora erythraea NRRL 2338]
MAARIAVVGGSVAGLSSAILLARRGFEVDLYERDTPPPDDLDDVQQWNRPGAPQTQHPHVFLGLFRKLLRQNLPDVHEDMLAGGVEELPFSCPLAATAPGDEDLLMMAARRTTLEWALHRARGRESRIRYCPGASVQLGDVDNGTLKGIRTAEGDRDYDAVLDATGARSKLGLAFTPVVSDIECGKVYNSRFYVLRDGAERPPLQYGSVSVVDGLGYGAALFYHDRGTFSIDIGRLPEDDAMKKLRDPHAFDRVVAMLEPFRPWFEDGKASPISEVVPMPGLRNVLRGLAPDAPKGYFPVGDRVCLTDPTFGRGLALALAHAVRIAETFAGTEGELAALNVRTTQEQVDYVRPWFDDVVVQDVARTSLWRAAVEDEPWQHLLPDMPPNPFLMIDAEEHDPELGQAARRYVSMLTRTVDTSDIHERIQAIGTSSAKDQAAASAPTYAQVLDALGVGVAV